MGDTIEVIADPKAAGIRLALGKDLVTAAVVDATAHVLVAQTVELADGSLVEGKPQRKAVSLAWLDAQIAEQQVRIDRDYPSTIAEAERAKAEAGANVARLQGWRDGAVKAGATA